MAKIQQYLDNIKNALFGRELRGSIHDGIYDINKEFERTTAKQEHLDGTFNQLIINSGTSNAEIVDARVEADGTQHPTLGHRLNHMDNKFKEVNSQLEHIRYRIHFVDDFGAKGDGVTDDTGAIQRALDEQGIIMLSQGKTYRTTYSLLLKSDTTLDGQNATIHFDSNASSAIAVYGYNDSSNPTKNLTLKNFHLTQRTYASENTCDTNGIWLPFCDGLIVDNVSGDKIRWHLLDIPSSKNVVIKNCHATNLDSAAIQIDGTLVQSGSILLKDGLQVTNELVKKGCENIVVENCVIENCETGIHLHRDGANNIKFINNTIIGCSYSGILSDENQEYNNLIIKKNYFKDCRHGIHLRGYGRKYEISNNKLLGNNIDSDMGIRLGFALNGLDFYGDCIISNNFVSNYFRAIFMQQAENLTIKQNILKECGYIVDAITDANNKNALGRFAICFENVKNSIIADNLFIGNYFCDIQLLKSLGIDIVGNKSTSVGNFINGSSNIELKEKIRILNNSINNNSAFNTINIDTCVQVVIKDNEITQNANNSILLINGEDCECVHNKITGANGSFGIRLYNSDSYFHYNMITNFSTPYSFEAGGGECNVSGVLLNVPSRSGTVNGVITYYSNSTPNHDSFSIGSKIINTAPIAGGFSAWIKTGSFTWKGFGEIKN